MTGTRQRSGLERATGRPVEAPERLLFDLEDHHARLCGELAALESRLRVLRTEADLCPLCGGGGLRWVRGGLYGELQQRPCPCGQDAPRGSAP